MIGGEGKKSVECNGCAVNYKRCVCVPVVYIEQEGPNVFCCYLRAVLCAVCDCDCVRVTTACIELIAGRGEFTVLYNRFGIRAEILISVETELAVFKGNKGNAACVRRPAVEGGILYCERRTRNCRVDIEGIARNIKNAVVNDAVSGERPELDSAESVCYLCAFEYRSAVARACGNRDSDVAVADVINVFDCRVCAVDVECAACSCGARTFDCYIFDCNIFFSDRDLIGVDCRFVLAGAGDCRACGNCCA